MRSIHFVLLLLFSSAQSFAGTIVCAGTVEEVSYHANDKLMLRLSSMNTVVFFCSPSSEWTVSGTTYKTQPETCKTLFSLFLAARISGEEVSNVYFDGDDVPATCDGWENWKNANIRHFRF